MYKQLRREKERQDVAKRIQMNPGRTREELTDAGIKEQIMGLRTQLKSIVRR